MRNSCQGNKFSVLKNLLKLYNIFCGSSFSLHVSDILQQTFMYKRAKVWRSSLVAFVKSRFHFEIRKIQIWGNHFDSNPLQRISLWIFCSMQEFYTLESFLKFSTHANFEDGVMYIRSGCKKSLWLPWENAFPLKSFGCGKAFFESRFFPSI